MKKYRIELPDTPIEEEHGRRAGRVLGPQTVIYCVCAHTYEDAIKIAIDYEKSFTYRVDVWLFGSRELLNEKN